MVASFPYEFTGYSVVLCVVVLYYLLLHARVRAKLLILFTRCLGPVIGLLLGPDQHIKIGSLGVAMLQGKLYLNHVEYRSKNAIFRIVECTISIAWWAKKVREPNWDPTIVPGESLPFGRSAKEGDISRLSINLRGVECIMHHNSAKYDHLESLNARRQRTNTTAAPNGSDAKSTANTNKKKDDKKQPDDNGNGNNDNDTKVDDNLPSPEKLDVRQQMASLPWFYGYFPDTQVRIQNFSMILGNTQVPSFFVVRFRSAQVNHAPGPTTSAHSAYRVVTDVRNLLDLRIFLARNPDYNDKEDMQEVKKVLDQETFFSMAMENIRHIKHLWREDGEHDDKDMMAEQLGLQQRRTMPPSSSAPNGTAVGAGAHLSGYRAPTSPLANRSRMAAAAAAAAAARDDARIDEGKEDIDSNNGNGGGGTDSNTDADADAWESHDFERLLVCDELDIRHTYDIGTTLKKADVEKLRYANLYDMDAPYQNITIDFKGEANITYGPYFDNQRALFMSYFLPWDYRNQVLYVPTVGDVRWQSQLRLQTKFSKNSSLRVPYRASYPVGSDMAAMAAAMNSRRNGGSGGNQQGSGGMESDWLSVTFASGSNVEYIQGNLARGPEGTKTSILAELINCAITASITREPITICDSVEVEIDLNYPLQWNALYKWKFTHTFHNAKLYYVMNYNKVWSDLTADWSSYSEDKRRFGVGGPGLPYFYPMEYTYEISFANDYEVYLNANENNIIDVINDSKQPVHANTHILVKGPDFSVVAQSQYLSWKPRTSEISYHVALGNVQAHLILPDRHPLNDLLENKNRNRFAYINTWLIDGSYRYHTSVPKEKEQRNRDSHSMTFKLEGGEIDLGGHYLRYLISVKDNYFGDWTQYCSTDEFMKAGYRNLKSYLASIKTLETPFNFFETSLTLNAENVAINLPANLYSSSSHQPKARFYDLQLELRSVLQYTDFLLCVSPITITFPTASLLTTPEVDTLTWNERETYVTINDLQLSMHWSKGDVPRCTCYRSMTRFNIGEIKAQMAPWQMNLLVTCITNIVSQWIDAEDHSFPRANEAPDRDMLSNPEYAMDDDVRNLKNWYQEKESESLGDITTEVALGIVRINLLHPPVTFVPAFGAPLQSSSFASQQSSTIAAAQAQAAAAAGNNRVRHPHTLAITRLLLLDGVQMYSTSLITQHASSRMVVEIPSVHASHLAHQADLTGASAATVPLPSRAPHLPSPSYDANENWVCLAQLNTAIVFTNAQLRSDWMDAMRRQQDFIYSQMHQEGLRDDIDAQQQWHESNALRVPYTAADDSPFAYQTTPTVVAGVTNGQSSSGGGSGSGGSNTPAGSSTGGNFPSGVTPPLSPYEPMMTIANHTTSAMAHNAMPFPATPMAGFRSPIGAMFQRRMAYSGHSSVASSSHSAPPLHHSHHHRLGVPSSAHASSHLHSSLSANSNLLRSTERKPFGAHNSHFSESKEGIANTRPTIRSQSHANDSGDEDGDDAPPRDAHRRRGDALHPETLKFAFTAPRRSFNANDTPAAAATSTVVTKPEPGNDDNNPMSPSDHRPMRTPLSSRRRFSRSQSSSDSACSDDSFHSAGSGDDDDTFHTNNAGANRDDDHHDDGTVAGSLPATVLSNATPKHASIPLHNGSDSDHNSDDGGDENESPPAMPTIHHAPPPLHNQHGRSNSGPSIASNAMPLPSVEEDGWPLRHMHHALRVEASAPQPDPFMIQLVHLSLRPYSHTFLVPRAHRFGGNTSVTVSSPHSGSLQSRSSRRARTRRESNFAHSSPYLSDATLAGTSAGAFLELPFADFELRHGVGTPQVASSASAIRPHVLHGAGFHHFAPSSGGQRHQGEHSPYEPYQRPSSRTGPKTSSTSSSHHLGVPSRIHVSPAPPETPLGGLGMGGFHHTSGTPGGVTPTLPSANRLGGAPRTPRSNGTATGENASSLRHRLQDSRPTADFTFFDHTQSTPYTGDAMDGKRSGGATAAAAAAAMDRSDIGHRYSVVGDEMGSLVRLNDASVTMKRHVELTKELHVMVTPLFVVAIDQYLPVLQPATSTLEDTLDEIHKQFAAAFSGARSTPPINHIPAVSLHVLVSQLSVSVPAIHIDLVQLSGPLNFARAPSPSSRRSSMDHDGRRVPSRRFHNTFASPATDRISSSNNNTTVFFSSLYVDGLQLFHQTDIPRPESSAAPSTHTTISFQRAYAYSSLLVTSRPIPFSPMSRQPGARLPRSFSFSLDKDAFIPPTRLARFLSDDILTSQAVFISCQIGFSSINLTHTLTAVSATTAGGSSFGRIPGSTPADTRGSTRGTPSANNNNNNGTKAATTLRSPVAANRGRTSPQMSARSGLAININSSNGPAIPPSPAPGSTSSASSTTTTFRSIMSPVASRHTSTPPVRGSIVGGNGVNAFAPTPLSPAATNNPSVSPVTTVRTIPSTLAHSQSQLLIVPSATSYGNGPASPRGGAGSSRSSRIDTTAMNLLSMANTPPLTPNPSTPATPKPPTSTGGGSNAAGGARLFRSMSSSAVSPTHAKRSTLPRGFTVADVDENDEKREYERHDSLDDGTPSMPTQPQASSSSAPLPPLDPYTNTNTQNHTHHNGIRVRLDQVSVLLSGHTPCLVLTALDTWTYAASKLEVPQALTEPLGMYDQPPDRLTLSVEGGAGNRLRLARWQTVLAFALKHILHSRALDGRGQRALKKMDQERFLAWLAARWPDQEIMNYFAENEMLHLIPRSDPNNMNGSRSQSFSSPPPLVSSGSFIYTGPPAGLGSVVNGGKLYPQQMTFGDMDDEDAIIQRHSSEYLAMINYTNSRCGPLTITLRKLLNLPSGLQRTLNVKLQLGELPKYHDYSKLLELKNLTATTSLSILTLRKFARIAPAACRLIPLDRDLSPSLSSRTIADPLHRTEFDTIEHNVEWSILRVRFSIVEADANDDDHDLAATARRANHTAANSSNRNDSKEGQPSMGTDEGGLPILTVKDHCVRTNGLSGKASYLRHGHAHIAWKQAAILKARHARLASTTTASGGSGLVHWAPTSLNNPPLSSSHSMYHTASSSTALVATLPSPTELFIVTQCAEFLVEVGPGIHTMLANLVVPKSSTPTNDCNTHTARPSELDGSMDELLIRSPSLGQLANNQVAPIGVPPLSLHCQVSIAELGVTILSPDVGSLQLNIKKLTLTIGNHTRTSPIRSLLSSDREVKSSFRGGQPNATTSGPTTNPGLNRRKSGNSGASSTASTPLGGGGESAAEKRREEIRARRAERQSRGRGTEWTSNDMSTRERKTTDGGGSGSTAPSLRRTATMIAPPSAQQLMEDERTVEITLFYANTHMDSFDLRLLSSPIPTSSTRSNNRGNVLFSVLSRHLAVNLSHMSPSGSIHPIRDSAMALAGSQTASIPMPNGPPAMITSESEEQLLWSQLVVVLRSDQNIVTLPIHSFEGVHFDDFIDCWAPLRELLAPAAPLVNPHDSDTNGAGARQTFTYQHGDGFAADTATDSFGKLRAEDSLFERAPDPTSSSNPSSTTAAPNTAAAVANALIPGARVQQRAFMQWRVAIQLSNNSVVVTPLPSIMLTYHLNQFRCRLAQPSPNQRHLLFSVGQAGREDEVDEPFAQSSSSEAKAMSNDDNNDTNNANTSGKAIGDQLASGAHMMTLHHAKKAKAKRAKKSTTKDGKEDDTNTTSAASSSAASAAAAAATKLNMELVLDFKLPPLRGALSLKKTIVKMIPDDDSDIEEEDDAAASNDDDTPKPTPKQPTASLSSKQRRGSRSATPSATPNNASSHHPRGRRASTRQTRARSGSDVSSRGRGGTTSSTGSGGSSGNARSGTPSRRPRSESTSSQEGSSEDSTATAARRRQRAAANKIPAGSRAVTEIEGVIAVGSMSNHIDENVLHRLLQFQSVLNQEIVLIIERINRAINKSSGNNPNAPPVVPVPSTMPPAELSATTSPSLHGVDGSHLMSPATSLVGSSSMVFPSGYAADYWRDMSRRHEKKKKAVAREHPGDKFAVNIKFVLRGIELTAGLAPVHRAVLMQPSDTISEMGDTVSTSGATNHRRGSVTGGGDDGDHFDDSMGGMHQTPSRWEPLVRVETGRFNFSVRFLPSTSPLLQGTWSASTGSSSTNGTRPRRDTADRDERDGPPSARGGRKDDKESKHYSANGGGSEEDDDDDPLLGSPGSVKRRRGVLSDVQLEVGFTGLALSLVIPYHDHTNNTTAMFPMTVAYKTLFELESNIRIHAGCDVDLTDFSGHIAFASTRVRVTAVPALLGSLYNFCDHYLAAFRDYQAERERLVREKAIQVPLVALGAEKAREVKDKAQQWVNQRLASDGPSGVPGGMNNNGGIASGESSEAATPAPGIHLGGHHHHHHGAMEQGRGWRFSGEFQFTMERTDVVVLFDRNTALHVAGGHNGTPAATSHTGAHGYDPYYPSGNTRATSGHHDDTAPSTSSELYLPYIQPMSNAAEHMAYGFASAASAFQYVPFSAKQPRRSFLQRKRIGERRRGAIFSSFLVSLSSVSLAVHVIPPPVVRQPTFFGLVPQVTNSIVSDIAFTGFKLAFLPGIEDIPSLTDFFKQFATSTPSSSQPLSPADSRDPSPVSHRRGGGHHSRHSGESHHDRGHSPAPVGSAGIHHSMSASPLPSIAGSPPSTNHGVSPGVNYRSHSMTTASSSHQPRSGHSSHHRPASSSLSPPTGFNPARRPSLSPGGIGSPGSQHGGGSPSPRGSISDSAPVSPHGGLPSVIAAASTLASPPIAHSSSFSTNHTHNNLVVRQTTFHITASLPLRPPAGGVVSSNSGHRNAHLYTDVTGDVKCTSTGMEIAVDPSLVDHILDFNAIYLLVTRFNLPVHPASTNGTNATNVASPEPVAPVPAIASPTTTTSTEPADTSSGVAGAFSSAKSVSISMSMTVEHGTCSLYRRLPKPNLTARGGGSGNTRASSSSRRDDSKYYNSNAGNTDETIDDPFLWKCRLPSLSVIYMRQQDSDELVDHIVFTTIRLPPFTIDPKVMIFVSQIQDQLALAAATTPSPPPSSSFDMYAPPADSPSAEKRPSTPAVSTTVETWSFNARIEPTSITMSCTPVSERVHLIWTLRRAADICYTSGLFAMPQSRGNESLPYACITASLPSMDLVIRNAAYRKEFFALRISNAGYQSGNAQLGFALFNLQDITCTCQAIQIGTLFIMERAWLGPLRNKKPLPTTAQLQQAVVPKPRPVPTALPTTLSILHIHRIAAEVNFIDVGAFGSKLTMMVAGITGKLVDYGRTEPSNPRPYGACIEVKEMVIDAKAPDVAVVNDKGQLIERLEGSIAVGVRMAFTRRHAPPPTVQPQPTNSDSIISPIGGGMVGDGLSTEDGGDDDGESSMLNGIPNERPDMKIHTSASSTTSTSGANNKPKQKEMANVVMIQFTAPARSGSSRIKSEFKLVAHHALHSTAVTLAGLQCPTVGLLFCDQQVITTPQDHKWQLLSRIDLGDISAVKVQISPRTVPFFMALSSGVAAFIASERQRHHVDHRHDHSHHGGSGTSERRAPRTPIVPVTADDVPLEAILVIQGRQIELTFAGEGDRGNVVLLVLGGHQMVLRRHMIREPRVTLNGLRRLLTFQVGRHHRGGDGKWLPDDDLTRGRDKVGVMVWKSSAAGHDQDAIFRFPGLVLEADTLDFALEEQLRSSWILAYDRGEPVLVHPNLSLPNFLKASYASYMDNIARASARVAGVPEPAPKLPTSVIASGFTSASGSVVYIPNANNTTSTSNSGNNGSGVTNALTTPMSHRRRHSMSTASDSTLATMMANAAAAAAASSSSSSSTAGITTPLLGSRQALQQASVVALFSAAGRGRAKRVGTPTHAQQYSGGSSSSFANVTGTPIGQGPPQLWRMPSSDHLPELPPPSSLTTSPPPSLSSLSSSTATTAASTTTAPSSAVSSPATSSSTLAVPSVPDAPPPSPSMFPVQPMSPTTQQRTDISTVVPPSAAADMPTLSHDNSIGSNTSDEGKGIMSPTAAIPPHLNRDDSMYNGTPDGSPAGVSSYRSIGTAPGPVARSSPAPLTAAQLAAIARGMKKPSSDGIVELPLRFDVSSGSHGLDLRMFGVDPDMIRKQVAAQTHSNLTLSLENLLFSLYGVTNAIDQYFAD